MSTSSSPGKDRCVFGDNLRRSDAGHRGWRNMPATLPQPRRYRQGKQQVLYGNKFVSRRAASTNAMCRLTSSSSRSRYLHCILERTNKFDKSCSYSMTKSSLRIAMNVSFDAVLRRRRLTLLYPQFCDVRHDKNVTKRSQSPLPPFKQDTCQGCENGPNRVCVG